MLTISSVIRRKKNIESINLGKHEYQIRIVIQDAADYFGETELTNYMPAFIKKIFFENDSISCERFDVTVSENLEVYIYFSKKELLNSKEKKDLNHQIKMSFYSLSEYIETARLKGKIAQIEVSLTEKLAKISRYESSLSEIVTKQELKMYESKVIGHIESSLIGKMNIYESQLTDFLTKENLENYSSELENTRVKTEQLETKLSESEISYEKQIENFITQQELEACESRINSTVKEAVEELEIKLVEKITSYEKQIENFITQQEVEIYELNLNSEMEKLDSKIATSKIAYERQAEVFITKQEVESYRTNVNSILEEKFKKLEINLMEKMSRFRSQLSEDLKLKNTTFDQETQELDLLCFEKSKELVEIAEEYEGIQNICNNFSTEKSKQMKEILQMNATDIRNRIQRIYDLFTSEKKAIKFKVHEIFIKNAQAHSYSNQLNYCFFYWQYLKRYEFLFGSIVIVEKETLKYLRKKLEDLPLLIEQYDQKFADKTFLKLSLSEKKEILAYIEFKKLLETYYAIIMK